MIQRKPGAVNDIVYEYTVYGGGKYNFYLPLYNLTVLIDKIIDCGEYTKHISFIPFFISSKTGYIEFDEYMCYIECSDNEDTQSNELFISECKSEKETMDEAREHYALCNDLASFQHALSSYKNYIQKIIPKLAVIIKSSHNLLDEDFLFGYFGFEVSSE